MSGESLVTEFRNASKSEVVERLATAFLEAGSDNDLATAERLRTEMETVYAERVSRASAQA